MIGFDKPDQLRDIRRRKPQREAADRLGDELGFRVLTLPTGQGLVLR